MREWCARVGEGVENERKKLTHGAGYKEVSLLGQNIDAYGRDLNPKSSFYDLLMAASKTKIPRVRYVTSHPRYFSDRVIDIVTDPSNSVCEVFHMPIQSGSNSILKAMRRGYTRESYMKTIEKIRAADLNAAITTDIIVGFPGETEEDFLETLEILKRVCYDSE